MPLTTDPTFYHPPLPVQLDGLIHMKVSQRLTCRGLRFFFDKTDGDRYAHGRWWSEYGQVAVEERTDGQWRCDSQFFDTRGEALSYAVDRVVRKVELDEERAERELEKRRNFRKEVYRNLEKLPPPELVQAMRDFKTAAIKLNDEWSRTPDRTNDTILGDSYGHLPSFDELTASVAGWEIPDAAS